MDEKGSKKETMGTQTTRAVLLAEQRGGVDGGWRTCESVACVYLQSSEGTVSGSKTTNR